MLHLAAQVCWVGDGRVRMGCAVLQRQTLQASLNSSSCFLTHILHLEWSAEALLFPEIQPDHRESPIPQVHGHRGGGGMGLLWAIKIAHW